MSKATVTGQITVTSNGTTLHTILQCTTGDVYQNYDGDPASPSNVVPNFEASGATKPKLVMQAYSAEQGAAIRLTSPEAPQRGLSQVLR